VEMMSAGLLSTSKDPIQAIKVNKIDNHWGSKCQAATLGSFSYTMSTRMRFY